MVQVTSGINMHAASLESFSRTDSGAGLIIKPQELEQAEEAVKDDFQLAAPYIRVEIEDDTASVKKQLSLFTVSFISSF